MHFPSRPGVAIPCELTLGPPLHTEVRHHWRGYCIVRVAIKGKVMRTAMTGKAIGLGFVLITSCLPGLALAQLEKGPAEYVRWLEERSMLHQATLHARGVSGSGVQWQHPYARPQTREVVRRASVWL